MALGDWLSNPGDPSGGSSGSGFWSKAKEMGPALIALGSSIAGAPRNRWGQGLSQGLGSFLQIIEDNKKKEALKKAFSGLNMDPTQKLLLEQYPNLAVPAMAENAFKAPKEAGGPFAGTGFDSSAANILVRGTLDPSVRSSPEYAIAYANATSPKVVMDAEGRQMLFTPPVPQGILPPMQGGQSSPAMTPPTAQPAPGAPAMSPRAAPPSGNAPPSAGFEPDAHPEMYPGGTAPSPAAPAQSGITQIPGTGKTPTEAQFKAGDYYTRMTGSEQIVSDKNAQADYMDWSNGVAREGGVGFLQGGKAQTYETAGDEWIAALLRKDSGAQVPPAELASLRRVYIPQWGDKEDRIAYKAAARKRAAEAIKAGLTPEQIVKSERVLSENPSPTLQGSYPTPPPQAIRDLKMRRDKVQFDEIFGPGAADKYLGGK